MPSPWIHATANTSAQTITTTTETSILNTDLISAVGAGGEGTLITGVVNITPGTAATGVTVRVRTGTTTGGTLIGSAALTTVIAASAQSITFMALDTTSSTPENTQYNVTVQQTAATGNATVNSVTLLLSDVTNAL